MSNKLNIQNSQQIKKKNNDDNYNNNQNVSLWKKGKLDIKKYYEVDLLKSTNIKSFLFGMLLTAIIILPFALILIQLYQAYIYHLNVCLFLIIIAWVMLWICNGLSNYFTIKITKMYYKVDPKLNSVDEFAVFFYETFNPGFIIFTMCLLLFIFLGLAGA